MKRIQAGFTIIELVVVIVILGILAAVALPKFIDLSGDAQQSAVSGVAGAAGAAMSINYAGCSAKNNVVTTNVCVQITNCNQIGSLLQGGLDTTRFSITAGAIGTGTGSALNGQTATCTLTYVGTTKTATFTGIAAGN